jgi:hypothetical protein
VPAFVIAGNCDLTFDTERLEHFKPRIEEFTKQTGPFDDIKPNFINGLDNITYLEEESSVWSGIKIFGSPYSPEFRDFGFPIHEGEGEARWSGIPGNVDIIISHGPPKGACDMASGGFSVGCPELRKVIERTKPALVVVGHIHEAFGVGQIGETLCVNAALAGPDWKVARDPVFVDLIPKA